MHKRQQGSLGVRRKRCSDLVETHGLPPLVLHHDRLRAATLHIFLHASAKDAIATDNHGITRGHQVDEAGLHTGRAGCRNWQGQRIARLESVLQETFHFVHQAHKERVKMANGRPAEGAKHSR